MRSSQAANFNELLSRMQALSVNLESQTQQTLSCEEPHVVSSHRLEPQPQPYRPAQDTNSTMYHQTSTTQSEQLNEAQMVGYLQAIRSLITPQ